MAGTENHILGNVRERFLKARGKESGEFGTTKFRDCGSERAIDVG